MRVHLTIIYKELNNKVFAPSKINEVTNTIPKMDSKFIVSEQGPVMPTGNTLDFALTQADTFFKIQDESGEVVYSRDGAFKILDGFLVDSNGQAILNNDNEPIATEEEGFTNLISVVRIDFKDLEKYKDNNYKVKEANVTIEAF